MTNAGSEVPGVEVRGAIAGGWEQIVTPEALRFVALLQREFERRKELLAARDARTARLDAGELPDFLPETGAIREGECLAFCPQLRCSRGKLWLSPTALHRSGATQRACVTASMCHCIGAGASPLMARVVSMRRANSSRVPSRSAPRAARARRYASA